VNRKVEDGLNHVNEAGDLTEEHLKKQIFDMQTAIEMTDRCNDGWSKHPAVTRAELKQTIKRLEDELVALQQSEESDKARVAREVRNPKAGMSGTRPGTNTQPAPVSLPRDNEPEVRRHEAEKNSRDSESSSNWDAYVPLEGLANMSLEEFRRQKADYEKHLQKDLNLLIEGMRYKTKTGLSLFDDTLEKKFNLNIKKGASIDVTEIQNVAGSIWGKTPGGGWAQLYDAKNREVRVELPGTPRSEVTRRRLGASPVLSSAKPVRRRMAGAEIKRSNAETKFEQYWARLLTSQAA
jgi:hypothetical protein